MCTTFIPGIVAKLTQGLPLVEQELLILPEHLISPPVFSGVRVTRSLVLCVYFVDRCFSFSPFSFGHCVTCSSVFWPLCYLFFFDIEILINTLVSSNTSYTCHTNKDWFLPIILRIPKICMCIRWYGDFYFEVHRDYLRLILV
jgi:hypothetical protein